MHATCRYEPLDLHSLSELAVGSAPQPPVTGAAAKERPFTFLSSFKVCVCLGTLRPPPACCSCSTPGTLCMPVTMARALSAAALPGRAGGTTPRACALPRTCALPQAAQGCGLRHPCNANEDGAPVAALNRSQLAFLLDTQARPSMIDVASQPMHACMALQLIDAASLPTHARPCNCMQLTR